MKMAHRKKKKNVRSKLKKALPGWFYFWNEAVERFKNSVKRFKTIKTPDPRGSTVNKRLNKSLRNLSLNFQKRKFDSIELTKSSILTSHTDRYLLIFDKKENIKKIKRTFKKCRGWRNHCHIQLQGVAQQSETRVRWYYRWAARGSVKAGTAGSWDETRQTRTAAASSASAVRVSKQGQEKKNTTLKLLLRTCETAVLDRVGCVWGQIYIHYRSKVWDHPDNFVFSMKTHTFIFQMSCKMYRKYSQDIDKVRNNDLYLKY